MTKKSACTGGGYDSEMGVAGYCTVCARTVYVESGEEPRCPVCHTPLEAALVHEPRAERIGRNEALARELNEGIKRGHEVAVADTMVVLCECGREDCSATISVEPSVYDDVRSRSARFIVARGHEIGDVEDTVAGNHDYVIVEKVGEAGEVAKELDPT